MRINVIRAYTDRETRLRVEAGSVLDVSDQRGEELIAKGFAAKDSVRADINKDDGGDKECPQAIEPSPANRTEKKSK